MPAYLLAPIAALLYLLATGLQLLHISQQRKQIGQMVVWLGIVALAGHAVVAWESVSPQGGVSLGIYKIAALMILTVNIVCIACLLLGRPLQNMLVILFPLSALSVVISTFAPDTSPLFTNLGGGMLLHIISSILAYAVLTLAALQSVVIALQDHQLRNHHTRGLIQALPPLQLMETMLFELLLIGMILLTISIVSGFIFVDDLFAQHLVHKTVLTMFAWVLFAVLLWGHHQLGWRSQLAVRLMLAGFTLLILAFFGSKLVLELILQSP